MPPPSRRRASTGGAGYARPSCGRSPRSRHGSRWPAESRRTSVRTAPPTRVPTHRGRRQRPYITLRKRVCPGRADRRLDDSHAVADEQVIERGRELAVAVADQESEPADACADASDLEQRQEASSDPGPAPTTCTNRLGTSAALRNDRSTDECPAGRSPADHESHLRPREPARNRARRA
jgi:hypothetical protein